MRKRNYYRQKVVDLVSVSDRIFLRNLLKKKLGLLPNCLLMMMRCGLR